MNPKAWLVFSWLLATTALGGLLTALHESPLPRPTATVGAPTPTWTMVHGLALRCPCSRRIVEHLVSRGAVAGVRELVVLVDATPQVVAALEGRGFVVESVGAQSLAAHGFEAVPGLLIRSPAGAVAYAGAHAPKRSAPVDDLGLLAAARAGRSPRPFAVLGCAISDALSARLDPLSLKFPSWPGVFP